MGTGMAVIAQRQIMAPAWSRVGRAAAPSTVDGA